MALLDSERRWEGEVWQKVIDICDTAYSISLFLSVCFLTLNVINLMPIFFVKMCQSGYSFRERSQTLQLPDCLLENK